ncbi:MAG TPA: aquaporin [Candidatus Angelobacter sp.]|nr:aquaporin [Candidatus Angelobacter sp.]
MNKYITELVGTFFLVFTIGCTVVGNTGGTMAPLAIGAALMVMVFAGGHISGAHYNPAVTLAIWMRGKIETKYVAGYVISQLVGAVLAALAVEYLKAGVQVVPMNLPLLPVLLAEFLFTFALVFVVLNTAFAKGTAGNSFYGLAIGFTVTAGVYAVGGISGGVFNPAVAVGISIMGLSAWSSIWIYLAANFAGGAVAAVAFKAVNPGDN